MSSDDEEGSTDGGTIALHGPGAGVQGPAGANIVLNAAKRSLVIRDKIGGDVVRLDGEEGEVIVRDKAGKNVFRVDGGNAALYIGAKGNEGDIIVRDNEGKDVFTVDGKHAALYIGAEDNDGDIIIRDDAGAESIHLNGSTGDITTKKERSRKVDQDQHFDLFSVAQDGSFVVELAPATGLVLVEEASSFAGAATGAGSYLHINNPGFHSKRS